MGGCHRYQSNGLLNLLGRRNQQRLHSRENLKPFQAKTSITNIDVICVIRSEMKEGPLALILTHVGSNEILLGWPNRSETQNQINQIAQMPPFPQISEGEIQALVKIIW